MSALYQENRIKDLLRDKILINMENISQDYLNAFPVWLTAQLEQNSTLCRTHICRTFYTFTSTNKQCKMHITKQCVWFAETIICIQKTEN